MRIQIRDHLILPFGTARKFDLQRIKLSSVAANGIYLNSDIPCVYINVAAKKPLTMQDFDILILGERGAEPEQDEDVAVGLDYIHKLIEKHMPPDTTTKYETMFLALYFDYLKWFLSTAHYSVTPIPPLSLYNALLPIPQMQIYVHDPLEDDWSGRFEPSNNFRVDFGFWTGTNLIAVEIDGNEPDGYARDIRRDRLLRRANVDVVHILNTEIDRHGKKVIHHVLPERIRSGWRAAPVPTSSPFVPF